MLYEEFGVLAEIDGKLGHVDGRFRDFARDNEHSAQGLLSFRFGSFDIRSQPCLLAAQLAEGLRARGWSGELSLCPHCWGDRR